jgi:hypothetical protein
MVPGTGCAAAPATLTFDVVVATHALTLTIGVDVDARR